MQLRAMLLRKAHSGENVVLASSISAASFGTLGPELIGDETPLPARLLGIVLRQMPLRRRPRRHAVRCVRHGPEYYA